MRSSIPLCCFFLLTGVQPSYSTVLDPALAGIRYYDPLQHSHLVFRGTVKGVRTDTKRSADWGFGAGGIPLTTQIVTIAVTDVLKGKWPQPEMDAFAFWSGRRFAPGEEYIFCAKGRDTKRARVLWIGELPGLYAKADGTWTRCSFPGSYGTSEVLTYEQIIERVGEASLSSVVDSSDVIVRGVVDSVWTSNYPARGGRFGWLEHRRLRVNDWFKGRSPGSHVEFVIPIVGASYIPRWYRAVPDRIPQGTEWIVFLKRGGRGLYPFGGPNSLLQVRGQELIYDGKATYPLGLGDALEAVRFETSHTAH